MNIILEESHKSAFPRRNSLRIPSQLQTIQHFRADSGQTTDHERIDQEPGIKEDVQGGEEDAGNL